jgi:ketosteroid isomerase-like protein
MSTSRRSALATAVDLAATSVVAAPAPSLSTDRAVAELVQLSEAANVALMRGDINHCRALIPFADDFTLMSPFGGPPTHARNLSEKSFEAMGRFFRNGSSHQEVVQAYGSADMVVLAVIEHNHVEVGGLPAQDWLLRVTLVYRREGAEWHLAHRHADPLVAGISLGHAATLARGERV